MLSKHQSEIEHKNETFQDISSKNELHLNRINELSVRVKELEKDL